MSYKSVCIHPYVLRWEVHALWGFIDVVEGKFRLKRHLLGVVLLRR